jgi:glyoxylase-like metal-dependent hydrolase (beta-lactamase superfamily II)
MEYTMEYLSVKAFQSNGFKIEAIKMGRTFMGKLIYPCFAYKIGDILIDTGCPTARGKLMAFLRKDPPKNVLITHAEEDHIGNLNAIQKEFDVEVYAHPQAKPFMDDPEILDLEMYQRFVWGVPEPCSANPIELDKTLQLGDQEIVPIETPGHRDHHLAFYDPKSQAMFTGDIYCGTRIKMYFPYEKFEQIYSSNQKLLNYKIESIYCAFRGKVNTPLEKIKQKLAFMDSLCEKVVKYKSQGSNPKQIRKQVLGKENFFTFITSGDMSKNNLIKSLLESL